MSSTCMKTVLMRTSIPSKPANFGVLELNDNTDKNCVRVSTISIGFWPRSKVESRNLSPPQRISELFFHNVASSMVTSYSFYQGQRFAPSQKWNCSLQSYFTNLISYKHHFQLREKKRAMKLNFGLTYADISILKLRMLNVKIKKPQQKSLSRQLFCSAVEYMPRSSMNTFLGYIQSSERVKVMSQKSVHWRFRHIICSRTTHLEARAFVLWFTVELIQLIGRGKQRQATFIGVCTYLIIVNISTKKRTCGVL